MDRTRDALTGRVLDGRYRIGARIARGGMATVHEAVDLRLDRPVAVKVMHEGLAADDEFVRRFQREARSAARLSDPHVTAVFDTGDDDGTLFLVMELVPGRTLRDLIRSESPVDPRRALALVEPVLAALAAAHRETGPTGIRQIVATRATARGQDRWAVVVASPAGELTYAVTAREQPPMPLSCGLARPKPSTTYAAVRLSPQVREAVAQ